MPNGVTLAGEGLNDLGQEPKTQAHLYGFTGAVLQHPIDRQPGGSRTDAAGRGCERRRPQIEQIMPRLYDKTIPILALALGILALGFALLYRAHGNTPAKESNERGRG